MQIMKKAASLVGVAFGLALFLPLVAEAGPIHLSTTSGATLGGLTFRNGDVVEYDQGLDVATLVFDEDAFGADLNVNAYHYIDSQNILLSMSGSGTLGGQGFDADDIIAYDVGTDTGSLFFDGGLFTATDENVDAVYLLSDGDIVLSTTQGALLGGLIFRDGDLVRYDFGSDTATIYMNEDLFSAGNDIDAVSILSDGDIILSTIDTATLGGLTFQDGDLARYRPGTDTATLYFAETSFAGDEDIDGVHAVPEPSTALLVGAGILDLAAARRRA